MSEDKISLALAFLKARPESAAATLEQHDIEDVAHFLTDIPHSYAAAVIQHLLPHYAARVCKLLSQDSVKGIFSSLGIGHIAAILRYYNKSRRTEFLNELPLQTQLGCSMLLNYSQDLAGAWLTPQIAAIPQDYTAKEALHYLKSTPDLVHTDFIFTLTRDRELKGRIRLVDVLKAKQDTPVKMLAQPRGHTLSARSRLTMVANHEDWKKFHEIPVLNRNQKFVGVLRHIELRKGLDALAPELEAQSPVSPLTRVGKVYVDVFLALFVSMKHIAKTDTHS